MPDIFDEVAATMSVTPARTPTPSAPAQQSQADIFDHVEAAMKPDNLGAGLQRFAAAHPSINVVDERNTPSQFSYIRDALPNLPAPEVQHFDLPPIRTAQDIEHEIDLKYMNAIPGPLRPLVVGLNHSALTSEATAMRPLAMLGIMPDAPQVLGQAAQQELQTQREVGAGRLEQAVTSGVSSLADLVSAGPIGAGLLFGAKGAEGAQEDIERRRAEGQKISGLQQAIDVAGQGAIGYIMGKLAPGQKVNETILKSVAPTLKNAVANSIKNVLISGGIGATENEVQQLASNWLTKHTGVNPDLDVTEGSAEALGTGFIFGAGGQALHEIAGARTPQAKTESARPSDEAAPSPMPAPVADELVTQAEAAVQQPAATEAKELPRELPEPRKGLTKVQLLDWAQQNGYNVAGLEDRGQRIIQSKLAEQKLQSAAERVMEVQRGENVRAMAEQRQLPPESTGWDAGQLRRFARENSYEVDERRVNVAIERGAKPRAAIREQIEEQYALPKGEGPAGEQPKPPAESIPTAEEIPAPIRPEPPTEHATWGFKELKQWAADNGYGVETIRSRRELTAAIARQHEAASFQAPRDNEKLQGFYTDEQIAKMSPEQRRDALDAVDPQNVVQRAGSASRPALPQESKQWSFAKLKTWAEENGYRVNGVNSRRALTDLVESQSAHDALAAEKKLRRTDPLTGAPNQIAYQEDANRIFADADAKKEHTAIVETDLGGLKVMNTVYGHKGGDEMLKLAHEAMREELRMPPQKDRPSDYLGSAAYRIGGDEFPAILRGVKSPEQAKAAMDRVQKNFDAKIAKAFPDLPTEACPFIAWNAEIRKPGDTRSIDQLRAAADAGVEPMKSKIKAERQIPEGRTELLDYIRRRQQGRAASPSDESTKPAKTQEQLNNQIAAAATVARESAKLATPILGEEHQRAVPRDLEKVLTPIASRIRDISPATYGRLMEMELNTHRRAARNKADLYDWIADLSKSIGKEGSDRYNAFKLAWLNRDIGGIKAMVPESLHAGFDETLSALKRVHQEQIAAGVTLGQIDNYLPRRVSDVAALKTSVGSDRGVFDDAFAQRTKLKGAPLTAEEKAQIATDVIAGYGPRKPGSVGPAHARERSIDTVTADQLKYYDDPIRALLGYFDAAAKATERAKFLGKNDDPSQLADAVGRIIVDADPNLSRDGQAEVASLLQTRLLADTLHMPTWARAVKKSIYATTITHVASGFSQLTDIATAGWRYGMGSTIQGFKDALHISPAERRIVLHDLGFDHMGQEFLDPSKMGKALELGTKWNLFQKIDLFTKEGELNAAMHFMENAASDPSSERFRRLQRDWQPVIGADRFDDAMNALRRGDVLNENVQSLAFMHLTEMQPVTLSNMPEQYLKMQAGRLWYTLHTFQLQQIDLIRREVARKLRTPGQRIEGLHNLAGLLAFGVLANFGKDLFRDLLTGKPLASTGMLGRTGDAVLGLIGLNRYVALDFKNSPIKTLLDSFLIPPVTQFDAPVHDVMSMGNGRGFESFKLLPVSPVNDLLYYWSPWGKGHTLNADAAKADYRKRLADVREQAYLARQQGDASTARSLLALYNDRRQQGPGDGRKTNLTMGDLIYPPPNSADAKAKPRSILSPRRRVSR